MSLFEYLAIRPDGSDVTGRLNADDTDDAQRLLAAQGLTVRTLTLIATPSTTEPAQPLSPAEAEQFAGHLAQFGATGLPLESGLRAAAAELDNPRIATALNDVARQLGQGASLEAAVARESSRLPRHLAGLIAAASRTGRLGAALAELLDHQRAARALRRDFLSSFAYPVFVFGATAVLITLILYGLTGIFQRMFTEFGLALPVMTSLVFWWRDVGLWVVLFCGVGGFVAAAVVRQSIGPVRWQRLIATMPVVGRMSYWSGMAEWTGLMSVLVHHDVPLPEALRLSAGGVRNAYVGDIIDSLSTAASRGKTLSDALAAHRQIPASLVPVIRWGESMGSLSEAFSTTRELLERRVRVRALMLRVVLPPMLFIVIVCEVAAIVLALFMPLISLVQGLT